MNQLYSRRNLIKKSAVNTMGLGIAGNNPFLARLI